MKPLERFERLVAKFADVSGVIRQGPRQDSVPSTLHMRRTLFAMLLLHERLVVKLYRRIG